MVPEKICL